MTSRCSERGAAWLVAASIASSGVVRGGTAHAQHVTSVDGVYRSRIRDWNDDPKPMLLLHGRIRGEMQIGVSAIRPVDSDYGLLISLWGYGGFQVLRAFEFQSTMVLGQAFYFGGRIGYSDGDGGTARADNAPLRMHATDVGGVVGLMYEWSGPYSIGRVGVQLEAGVAEVTTTLRGAEEREIVPRIAVAVVAGFALGTHLPRLLFRVGAQHMPYHGSDPVFSGVLFGATLAQPL